jgi:hypothetical protein
MGRRLKSPRAPKPLDTRGPGQGSGALRGGVGNEPAGLSEFDKVAQRYEVNLPASTELLRKKMLLKGDDSVLKGQVAEALTAAAYQHAKVPDEGTRIYGRAYQTLTNAQKESLLSLLEPQQQQVVREAFRDFVPAETPQPSRLETTQTVDLDPYLPPDYPDKTLLPVQRGDEVVTVSDGSATEWAKGQRERGYRVTQYAPNPQTKRGARRVIEVLESRAGEFTTEAPQALSQPNPQYGQTRDVVRARGFEPLPPLAERIVPSSFDELSPQAQSAVLAGNEIQDLIEKIEVENPDFLETREGQRLRSRLDQISREHPEAIQFIDNPELSGRAMPRDPQAPPEGRQALPRQMRLGYVIGDEANRSRNQWEVRGERRSRFGIPADAPNRAGWLEIATEPPEYRIVENADGSTTREMVKPRRLRSSNEVAAASLPFPTEVSRGSPRQKAQADNPTDQLRTEPRRSIEDAADEPLPDDAVASDQELAAALGESDYGPVFNPDETAKPVEDISRQRSREPRQYGAMLTKGTAEGSPQKVKSDRDFALREGKSMKDKLAEQLFRASMEWAGDPDLVTTARGIGDAGPEARAFGSADEGSDFGEAVIEEATGGGGEIRRKASATAPRTRGEFRPLPLDDIVPIWRGLIEDVQDGQIVYRRPTSYEIAGFLVDRADIPDPAMAGRLDGLVKASMEHWEQSSPAGKAKRTASRPYPSSKKRARDLDEIIASQRQQGDTRPRYSPEAERLLSEASSGSLEGFTQDAGDAASGFVPDAETAGGAPAGDANLADAFRNLKGGKSVGSPTNIGALLAMLTGFGAGASQQAEGGELPPLESLAMAKRRRSVAQTIQGSGTKPAAGGGSPPPPKNPPQPAAAGGAPNRRRKPAASGSASPPPTVTTNATTGPSWTMGDDFLVQGAKKMTGNIPILKAMYRNAPTLSATLGGAYGLVAGAPYYGPPVQRGFEYLTTGNTPPPPPTGEDMDQDMRTLFESLDAPAPQAMPPSQPMGKPGNNDTTLDIRTLQQMLGRTRTPQVM